MHHRLVQLRATRVEEQVGCFGEELVSVVQPASCDDVWSSAFPSVSCGAVGTVTMSAMYRAAAVQWPVCCWATLPDVCNVQSCCSPVASVPVGYSARCLQCTELLQSSGQCAGGLLCQMSTMYRAAAVQWPVCCWATLPDVYNVQS